MTLEEKTERIIFLKEAINKIELKLLNKATTDVDSYVIFDRQLKKILPTELLEISKSFKRELTKLTAKRKIKMGMN